MCNTSSNKFCVLGVGTFLVAGVLLFFFFFHLSLPISIVLLLIISAAVSYSIYAGNRYTRQTQENKILRDQLEKSALILSKQQEKTREIDEKIDSLHNRILMSKQQLESTFDAINDSICVLDPDLAIQRVNRAYSELVNTPIRDLLGRKCYHVLFHSRKPCSNCPTLHTIQTGNIRIRQAMSKDEDGRTYHYEMSSYPIKNDKGDVINVIESVHDVTEQHHMTEQLIRSEKLATIGIMTAGIAHEMNNPLSGISGNAANMLQMPDKYGLNEKAVQRLQSMLEASERATHIMRSLLDLSRRHEGRLVFADLNPIVSDALTKVHLPGYNKIIKEFKTDEKLVPIRCDPVKIEQVLINIITNSYYAIQEKKEKLDSSSENGKKPYTGRIFIQTQKRKRSVLVIIEDNGIGIPEEKKRYIFDPFYTTRPPGKGTGLGLSITHKIISEHYGRVWAESGSFGAKFFMEIPTAITNRS